MAILLENGHRLRIKRNMSSLTEIEGAADALPEDQQEILLEWLSERMRRRQLNRAVSHSVLEIAPVSLVGVICPLSSNDDLLGEMLEHRQ